MKTYDLIVVGAGPAGLLAAIAAGRVGLRVALLERKPAIGQMDRLCGQTLVSANEYYFNDLVYCNRAQQRIGFITSGISFPYDGPAQNLYAWHIYSPSGACIRFGIPQETRQHGDSGAVGIAIDKNVLLTCLLREATAAGVDVIAGCDVTSVVPEPSKVTVASATTTLQASYLIAADGTNSRIARLCGFNTDRTFYCYLLSIGGYRENLRVPEPDILISSITYTPPAPGFMFLFPRPYPGQHTVAFLTLDPRTDCSAVARYFMQENPFFADWFQGSREIASFGSAQRIFSPVREPYKNRVVLAGDAGACQELENTGAMLSGWKAGCAVAAAVREERGVIPAQALAAYVRWWQETYVTACPHETYMMNFALPYVIDREDDLHYLCTRTEQPLPPCWNPYTAVAHLGSVVQRLIPPLSTERPALVQKLSRMSLPLAEILSKTTKACEQCAQDAED